VSLHASHLRKLGLGALGLLAAAWLFGLVSFVRADGHFEATLPRRHPPPAGLHNLSRWDLGPTVRASSYFGDWMGHHHPLFLVDGREQPDLVAKWASAGRDRHPWIEILWREPHDLERVVLHHAGSRESPALTVRRYTVACLTASGVGPRVDVEANEADVATHALVCHQARGIRISFTRNDDDIVRVYEVETWGR
jgi:hypothetical protein